MKPDDNYKYKFDAFGCGKIKNYMVLKYFIR